MMTIRRTSLLVALLLVPCGCAPDASSDPSGATESGSEAGLVDVATPEIAPLSGPAAATTDATSAVETSAATAGGDAQAATAADPVGPKEVTLELMEWDGVKTIIESHKGKVVVVDCWATYCVPCRKEFPGLVTLSRELPEDVVCISVSLDELEDREKAFAFLEEQDSVLTNILCTTDTDTLYDVNLQELKIYSIPAVIVYDRDGSLARTFTGENPDGGEYTYAGHITPFVRELASQH